MHSSCAEPYQTVVGYDASESDKLDESNDVSVEPFRVMFQDANGVVEEDGSNKGGAVATNPV